MVLTGPDISAQIMIDETTIDKFQSFWMMFTGLKYWYIVMQVNFD